MAVCFVFVPPSLARADEPSGDVVERDGLNYEWIDEGGGIFRSSEPTYETRVGNPCFRRVHIPESIGDAKIRGVIAWDAEPHYHPRGPRSTIQTEMWRAFAAKHRFGMVELASRPIGVEETVAQIEGILEDMDVLYGRDECRHACYTFGGTSGTGQDTLELASHRPVAGRMIAGIPCSCDPGRHPPTSNVPLLVMNAGMEVYAAPRFPAGVPSSLERSAELVRDGFPVGTAVRLSAKHPQFRDDVGAKDEVNRQIAHSMLFAMAWLDAVIARRVPAGDPPAGRPFELLEIDPTEGWLATCEVDPPGGKGIDVDRGEASGAVSRYGHVFIGCQIAAYDDFPGGLAAAKVWLPDEKTARLWKTFHETGGVE
ncbi:MAG: hypothetical protein AAGJ97_12490 [Planctomycetota bacterium]